MDREIKIKNAYLQKIIDLAIDYDGYYDEETKQGNIECLAELIDEIAELAKKALRNEDTTVEYLRAGEKELNILEELIRRL